MKRWWVRFECADLQGFEYHGPWWVSGTGGPLGGPDRPIVCMAVCAGSETAARDVVLSSFDEPDDSLEFSFVHEREVDWEPFGERFGRREWMHWPITPVRAAELRGTK